MSSGTCISHTLFDAIALVGVLVLIGFMFWALLNAGETRKGD